MPNGNKSQAFYAGPCAHYFDWFLLPFWTGPSQCQTRTRVQGRHSNSFLLWRAWRRERFLLRMCDEANGNMNNLFVNTPLTRGILIDCSAIKGANCFFASTITWEVSSLHVRRWRRRWFPCVYGDNRTDFVFCVHRSNMGFFFLHTYSDNLISSLCWEWRFGWLLLHVYDANVSGSSSTGSSSLRGSRAPGSKTWLLQNVVIPTSFNEWTNHLHLDGLSHHEATFLFFLITVT